MTSEQLFVVGLLASAITFVLRVLVQYAGYRPPRVVVTVGLYAVASILAITWSDIAIPSFPPFTDVATFVAALVDYVTEWLAVGAPVVGLATLIYNILYEKVVIPLRNRLLRSK